MVRLSYRVSLQYEVLTPGTDFIFCIQPARTLQQRVIAEDLQISQAVVPRSHMEAATHNRQLRLQAGPGALQVDHQATVDIQHYRQDPATVGAVRVADLPDHVLPWLVPSRYCQSDLLHSFAMRQFGTLWQGYSRVQHICHWAQANVQFASNSSDSSTSATDTLASRRGVCRDFAHLMIALCRALNIPARFATGFDYGADPALGPQDFHAYVEVWLGGRWYLFDPSGTAIPMGFVRLATGRDAADAAFATIFGSVRAQPPVVHIEAVADDLGRCVVPTRVTDALSTDAGYA